MKSSSHISIASTEEKNRIDSDVAFLVALEVDVKDQFGNDIETLYLINNNENLTFNGHEYVAFPFELDLTESAGEESVVSASIHDLSGAIKQRMEAFGGGVGFVVRIMVINSALASGDPEVEASFEVISADVNDFIVEWRLGAESHLSLLLPRRRQIKDRCAWRYKGLECGYTGGLNSCDYTLQGPNGCAAHNNTLNFGGFPGINAV